MWHTAIICGCSLSNYVISFNVATEFVYNKEKLDCLALAYVLLVWIVWAQYLLFITYSTFAQGFSRCIVGVLLQSLTLYMVV